MDVLNELLAAMRVLRLRMLNSLEPIGILLRKSESQLFCDVGKNLHYDQTLEESWQYFCDHSRRHPELSALSGRDIHTLDVFFRGLGKSGRDEQCALFTNIIEEMESAHAHAKGKYADAAKLYTALGALIGIAACVLIV